MGLRPQLHSDLEGPPLVPPAEWRALRFGHPNVLLVGAESVTRSVIDQLRPFFHGATITWPGGPSDRAPQLPAAGGTLVIRDTSALGAGDQQRLLEWLVMAKGRAQVVAAARSAVFPLVEAGLFSEDLYYRLNTVLLDFRF